MSFRTADERAAGALARRVMGDKDKKLQKYFSQFWWYMPDAQWKSDTSDFTPREWKLINEGE
ncbi:MAG: YARHG domain-containing protein [Bacteroidaceae bacterium]|nr:YARHG domain-containing protein [Bacteroidaceae bacterium]